MALYKEMLPIKKNRKQRKKATKFRCGKVAQVVRVVAGQEAFSSSQEEDWQAKMLLGLPGCVLGIAS